MTDFLSIRRAKFSNFIIAAMVLDECLHNSKCRTAQMSEVEGGFELVSIWFS